jgi:hypothetical protein
MVKINDVYLLQIVIYMHYLYKHVRTDTNEVFYVGVGTKTRQNKFFTLKSEFSRAYDFKKRNKIWKRIVAKTDIKVEILFESNDILFIQQKEKELISFYGRLSNKDGKLANLAIGGDSQSFNMNIRIKQLNIDGSFIKVWDQLKDIEKELGYLKTNVVKCCRKKQLTAYGYKWEYADDRSYDNVYATAARKKTLNNRVGIYVTDGTTTEIYRTAREVAKKYNCHITTVHRYLNKKSQHKFLEFTYALWI